MNRLIFAAFVLLVFSGCAQAKGESPAKNAVSDNPLILGYCPTMQEQAIKLQASHQNIKIVSFSSAEEVLRNLQSDKIAIALIGRKAKDNELSNAIYEKSIANPGLTLVNAQKRIISQSDLANMQIKTCLPEKSIADSFADLNFDYRTDCNYTDGGAWLISWNDYKENLELLIPIDQNGRKDKRFRSPYLYATKYLLDTLLF